MGGSFGGGAEGQESEEFLFLSAKSAITTSAADESSKFFNYYYDICSVLFCSFLFLSFFILKSLTSTIKMCGKFRYHFTSIMSSSPMFAPSLLCINKNRDYVWLSRWCCGVVVLFVNNLQCHR